MEFLVHNVIQLYLGHREKDVEEGPPLTPHFPESLAWQFDMPKVRPIFRLCCVWVYVETSQAKPKC